MRFATAADGCRLAYRMAGAPGAPRVVLLHSLALDHRFWNRVVAELAGEAQLIACDCRGHGASGTDGMPYRVEQFGTDLAAVLDHAGWRSAVVAGCSMGGCVAQAFAAAHPDRVEGLVLIDTTAWYGADAPAQWRTRGEAAREKGMASLTQFQVQRWFSEPFVASNRPAVDELLAVFGRSDVAAYASTCTMMGALDLRGRLRGLQRPCAVVVGAEDYATPVAMAEALHADIPGSTLSVIPAGRHLTPVQCPAEIAAAIRSVCAESRR